MSRIETALAALACLLAGAIFALFLLQGIDREALRREGAVRLVGAHHHANQGVQQ